MSPFLEFVGDVTDMVFQTADQRSQISSRRNLEECGAMSVQILS